MEYIIESDNISLDYSEERDLPYRITLYDKYGHFDREILLSYEQGHDLAEAVNNKI